MSGAGRVLGWMALLALVVAGGAQGLYVYIPDVLVVSTSDDADKVLDELELSFGVQGSDDPALADRPELKRLDRTVRVMTRHWEGLDAACDFNAVFALLYLVMTWNVRLHVAEAYFQDNHYLSAITVSFAKLYLGAWSAWQAGDLARVQKGWQEAFGYAASQQSSITEDIFLGINAHVNYDLAVAIAGLGLTGPDGTSRKPDMDRINHILADATDEADYYIALYYGPQPPRQAPSWRHVNNSEEATWLTIEPIALWRENSWKNAEIIAGAPDEAARQAHDAYMQEAAWAVAQGFQSPKLVAPGPERLAYCQTHP